jgi:hypothetical protein
MDRTSVDSSLIKSLGYDEPSQVLEVEFHRGAVYQYLAVPTSVYEDLQSSESVGKSFNALVKTQGYEFKQL